MEKKYYITNRTRNFIVVILSLFFTSLIVFSFVKTRSWIDSPFAGFLALKNNLVSLLNMPEWEGSKAGIKTGDVIVAVNGHPITSADELDAIVWRSEPGTPLTYTISRGLISKQELQLTIPVTVFTLKDYLSLFLGKVAKKLW